MGDRGLPRGQGRLGLDAGRLTRMELRAFALHADRDPQARATARAALAACGLPGDPWPMVDGAGLSASDLAATVGADLFAPAYPLSLGVAEIGRFLTYRQVWAEIERSGMDAALILDGVTGLDPEAFDDALDLSLPHVAALGIVSMRTAACPGPSALIDTHGAVSLTVPQQSQGRPPAQLVGHEAAAHLLALSDRFDRPVETFQHSHWHTGLRPASVQPCGLHAATPPELAPPPGGVWPRVRYDLAQRGYLRAVSRAARDSAAPATGGFLS